MSSSTGLTTDNVDPGTRRILIVNCAALAVCFAALVLNFVVAEAEGHDCKPWRVPSWGVSVAVIAIAGVVSYCLAVVNKAVQQRNLPLHIVGTNKPPDLTLPEGKNWHIFLSHTWKTGQDQVSVIKHQLRAVLPGVRVWLDVDELDDLGKLEEFVHGSAMVLVFLSQVGRTPLATRSLTPSESPRAAVQLCLVAAVLLMIAAPPLSSHCQGYFLSKNCLRELRAALDAEHQVPLLLVHEMDQKRGGATFDEMQAECPDDLRGDVFFGAEQEGAVVPWLCAAAAAAATPAAAPAATAPVAASRPPVPRHAPRRPQALEERRPCTAPHRRRRASVHRSDHAPPVSRTTTGGSGGCRTAPCA